MADLSFPQRNAPGATPLPPLYARICRTKATSMGRPQRHFKAARIILCLFVPRQVLHVPAWPKVRRAGSRPQGKELREEMSRISPSHPVELRILMLGPALCIARRAEESLWTRSRASKSAGARAIRNRLVRTSFDADSAGRRSLGGHGQKICTARLRCRWIFGSCAPTSNKYQGITHAVRLHGDGYHSRTVTATAPARPLDVSFAQIYGRTAGTREINRGWDCQ